MATVAGMRGNLVYRGRHVTVTFELDRKGIAVMAVGKELRHSCHEVVAKALPYAVSISPRSSRDHQHYQDSFVTESTLTGLPPESIGKIPMLRVSARLVNIAAHAAAVEWGDMGDGGRGYRVLRRTLQHIDRTSRG